MPPQVAILKGKKLCCVYGDGCQGLIYSLYLLGGNLTSGNATFHLISCVELICFSYWECAGTRWSGCAEWAGCMWVQGMFLH